MRGDVSRADTPISTEERPTQQGVRERSHDGVTCVVRTVGQAPVRVVPHSELGSSPRRRCAVRSFCPRVLASALRPSPRRRAAGGDGNSGLFASITTAWAGRGRAGGNDDSDRVEAWLRSTAAAIGVVRAAGIERVSLVGMRIGGTLAAQAAANDGRIEQLVLWDPCVSDGDSCVSSGR